jgi:uncharacterized membrane protein YfbV (UPF0208 family)
MTIWEKLIGGLICVVLVLAIIVMELCTQGLDWLSRRAEVRERRVKNPNAVLEDDPVWCYLVDLCERKDLVLE